MVFFYTCFSIMYRNSSFSITIISQVLLYHLHFQIHPYYLLPLVNKLNKAVLI